MLLRRMIALHEQHLKTFNSAFLREKKQLFLPLHLRLSNRRKWWKPQKMRELVNFLELMCLCMFWQDSVLIQCERLYFINICTACASFLRDCANHSHSNRLYAQLLVCEVFFFLFFFFSFFFSFQNSSPYVSGLYLYWLFAYLWVIMYSIYRAAVMGTTMGAHYCQ